MQLLSWSAFGQSGFELLRSAVISRVGLMRAEIRAYTYLYGVQYGVHGLECRHGRKMGGFQHGRSRSRATSVAHLRIQHRTIRTVRQCYDAALLALHILQGKSHVAQDIFQCDGR
ncbi:hypothetical protein VFPPC_18238 [Pochonia chlamydosporia 170]|uniref:Uncharacterized protein n=1 Tax=Pochonia chlamydosporia 170 TaxID=1380566 RepID=A0A219AP74_METCM|nr:hypothetical protein VFPPC_18238 [Pochonia chlamydosporia 170]OWT42626.1 hypothetical protein VFPPC_18238 [Pochonia chlamydosporia 170]